MRRIYKNFHPSVLRGLRQGKIAVIPTDTIYGISAGAFQSKAILKIYRIRRRDSKKRLIVLISSISDLRLFGVRLDSSLIGLLKAVWPGAVTIDLPIFNSRAKHLHAGFGTVGFRLPNNSALRKLLKKTGPLVSTSVNLSGEKPAETISEAVTIFGEKIDFYVDKGKRKSKPSTVVIIKNGKFSIVRQGAFNIPGRLMHS